LRAVAVIAMHALDDPLLPYEGADIGPGTPDQLPVESALAAWAEHDSCGHTPAESTTGEGGAVLTWPDCTAPVSLHQLPSGGYDRPAIASDIIAVMVAAR